MSSEFRLHDAIHALGERAGWSCATWITLFEECGALNDESQTDDFAAQIADTDHPPRRESGGRRVQHIGRQNETGYRDEP